MRSNAGFIGFDGTENKRTVLALQKVKEAAKIDGDLNVLLRKPHGRARSMKSKFNRLFDVKASFSDDAGKEKWENAGVKIAGGYNDFFDASDFIMVGTPGDEEIPYVEAALAHDCFVSLMGGADRPAILESLQEKKMNISDELKADIASEFFFCLENYDVFLKAKQKPAQGTSCHTTGLSRLASAARPSYLTVMLGNNNRRHGDPHTVVRASPGAIQFGKGAGHQGTEAGTVFEDVKFAIRASKVPTMVPNSNFFKASDQMTIRTLGYKKIEYIDHILKHRSPISPVKIYVKLPGA